MDELAAQNGRERMSALPPGPRMPRALQAVGWTQRPLPFLEQCQRRYGDTFTLRIRHYGDWVILSDPDDVKKVFTAGRRRSASTPPTRCWGRCSARAR